MASNEQQIYNALISKGLSAAQAIGVMGNMQAESSFNVESAARDSNGQISYGLVQWNAGSYPNAAALVTGNVATDLQNQINFLLHSTNNIGKGLTGTTPAAVAGNFAQFVEICQGCQPGQSSYNNRIANANRIANEATSGQWAQGGMGVPTSPGQAAQSSQGANFTIPLPNAPGLPKDPSLTIPWPGGSSGGGGGLLGIPSPSSVASDVLNTILKALGVNDLKDLFQRLGLILLGALIILIGLQMFAKTGITQAVSGLTGGGGGNVVQENGAGSEQSSNVRPRSNSSRRIGRTVTTETGATEAEVAALAV